MMINGTHDAILVVLSVLLAILASYTALDLAARARASGGRSRLGWLATAAVAMGGGIWSMHFVGMLAFSMPGMEVSYEPGLTLLSLAVAIVATGAGFLIMAQTSHPRLVVLVASGLVTGLGVAAMHYMGMAAMRMQADVAYDRVWMVISIFIAVGAATCALYLSSRKNRLFERLVAAVVMGIAVSGMHYAAMQGSVFRMQSGIDMAHSVASLGQTKLAIGVAASTFLILFLALIAAMFDRRYGETQTRLQEDLRVAYDRQSLLLRLGDRMRVLDAASTIMAESSEALGRFLQADRTGFYRIGPQETLDFDAGACWASGLPPLTGRHPAAACGTSPAVDDPLRASVDTSKAAAAVLPQSGVHAAIGIAHIDDESWRGGFFCHQGSPRDWTPGEISLVEEVSAMAWDAVRRADAREELHRLNEQLEHRVAQQTRDIRSITDALPVLIAFVDRTMTYRFANRAYEAWFFMTPDQVLGRNIADLTGPEQFELRRKHLDAALAGEETRFELSWPRQDGSARIAEIRYLPRRDTRGAVDGFYIFVLDITERVEAADRLRTINAKLAEEIRVQEQLSEELGRRTVDAEAANRAKSTFIANMSHELRTPLSAIIGYAEMLSEEIDEGATASDLRRDMSRIEDNARHLLGLINDVLDLSKVESGKMEAFAEEFDVRSLVEAVGSTSGTLMEKKSNRFVLDLGADGGASLGTMRSDVTRLRQILLNLLGNAAKFTENGTVTLAVERLADDRVNFAVSDTGIGMTPDQLAKLFRRFQQADPSTTRQFGGSGLGLALTKAFTALLKGEIAVTSTFGEGSTFTVTLPAHLEAESRTDETTADPPDSEDETLDHDVVLVIDDDQTQRDLTSRFLMREGFTARTAGDGQHGLALARRLKPRAILLDVTMPGMNGWSVLTALKADPELRAIPVVMVTFHSERSLAASLGAADYVMKPINWDRLRHVLAGLRDNGGDVLVVDDEREMRELLRHTLEKNGWRVSEATDGRQALEHVARAVPRVVLLDLNMPGVDGFGFLQELRERHSCREVPVIVLTARDLTQDDRSRLRGANQVLNKGDIRMSDLVERLRRIGTEATVDCETG